MENIIRNVLVEASLGEVVLTSRPRVIALPPLNVPRWGARTGAAWSGPQRPRTAARHLPEHSVFQGSKPGPAAHRTATGHTSLVPGHINTPADAAARLRVKDSPTTVPRSAPLLKYLSFLLPSAWTLLPLRENER